MAVPVLNIEEYYFGESPSGVKLNAQPEGGYLGSSFVDVIEIEGLDSTPVREDIHDREGMHGAYVEAAFETMRTITISGELYSSTANAHANALNQLKRLFAPTGETGVEQPFYFRTAESFEDGYRVVFAKSTGVRYRKDTTYGQNRTEFQVQLLCSDPRIYSTVETTQGQVLVNGVNNISLAVDGNRDTNVRIVLRGPSAAGLEVETTTTALLSLTYNLALTNLWKLHYNLEERSARLEEPGLPLVNARPNVTVVGKWFLPPTAGSHGFQITVPSGATANTRVDFYTRSAWR